MKQDRLVASNEALRNGAAQWSELFTETAQSFPGAVVNDSGGLSFNSIVPTPDAGYAISGVADARFSSGFAPRPRAYENHLCGQRAVVTCLLQQHMGQLRTGRVPPVSGVS